MQHRSQPDRASHLFRFLVLTYLFDIPPFVVLQRCNTGGLKDATPGLDVSRSVAAAVYWKIAAIDTNDPRKSAMNSCPSPSSCISFFDPIGRRTVSRHHRLSL
jgi:hypothetical protein